MKASSNLFGFSTKSSSESLKIELSESTKIEDILQSQNQSQKTQGFALQILQRYFRLVSSNERRSRSKIFLLFIWIKEPCVRKFEGLACSKLIGISQTEMKI